MQVFKTDDQIYIDWSNSTNLVYIFRERLIKRQIDENTVQILCIEIFMISPSFDVYQSVRKLTSK